ncbi:hypothetical protein AMTR_s00010p00179240 [Amborella trichopoda]|uniref:Uncharacterized protein n=1 Tax=Amborella trichopoda TaxID=13333 RepID=W1NG69_AMBTC|nr:hypothetical protein AMTR_s00010p00179240 [Amborella trichopoda]
MGIGAVVRKARAVSSARSNGNDLFKASRFSEACLAHGDGLQSDPLNTILLCNRAACRSKMGQWERAIEDCTAALNIRPSCTKARLLRADGNAKVSPKKHDQKGWPIMQAVKFPPVAWHQSSHQMSSLAV